MEISTTTIEEVDRDGYKQIRYWKQGWLQIEEILVGIDTNMKKVFKTENFRKLIEIHHIISFKERHFIL